MANDLSSNPRFLNIPADVPPVRYMKDSAPPHKVPEVTGKAFEAIVPDTCDVEESARLFLEHYLTEITVLNPEYLHEPFNRVYISATPWRFTLDFGTGLCALPKYRETLPLLRTMTGSRKGLEIDKAWAEHLLRCVGPDNLLYITRIGRPWDNYIGSGEREQKPWFALAEDAKYYASLPLGNGRSLGALSSYYKMTGDPIWDETARGIIDALNEKAIWVGEMAFFAKFHLLPDEKLSHEEIQQAIANLENPTLEETDRNTPLWQTFIITGLVQYYRVSKYEPVLKLARGLVNYIRHTKYLETWTSHFHCMTLAIQAFLELAQVTDDRELAEYARKAYDHGKSGEDMIALPQIGYFFNGQGADKGAEGCTVADMTTISLKLARLGMGDHYWDDADRYVRNCLTAIQRTRPDHASIVFQKLEESGITKDIPVRFDELADSVPERLVGTFSCHFYPNDFFCSEYFDTCCQGNSVRALYYVWENIIRREHDVVTVNLLLNRTSAWADIESCIPYTGRVDIKIKQPCGGLKVRMNDWIDLERVRCEVDGQEKAFTWDGRYVSLGALSAGQVVTLSFPISERTEQLDSFGHVHTAIFRGNDCVDLEPKGKFAPLFMRDHYREDKARYVKVKRFVADEAIDY